MTRMTTKTSTSPPSPRTSNSSQTIRIHFRAASLTGRGPLIGDCHSDPERSRRARIPAFVPLPRMSLSRQHLQRVMCYTGRAFKENERGHRRQALQQNPESGQRLRSLFPPQTFAIDCRPKKGPLSRKKTRWLLWLEDTSNGRVSPCSSSSSNPIALLTN
jgi:hypothetical protein